LGPATYQSTYFCFVVIASHYFLIFRNILLCIMSVSLAFLTMVGEAVTGPNRVGRYRMLMPQEVGAR
jgi:hypothetical protein